MLEEDATSQDGYGPGRALTRRALLAILGTTALAAMAPLSACSEDAPGNEPDQSDSGSQEPAGISASQAVCTDDERSYRVRFSTGSIVSAALDGTGEPTELYTNGYPRLTGIRYLLVQDGTVFFGDVPSGEVRSVPVDGGEAATVFAPNSTASQGATPRALEDGRLYVASTDTQTNQCALYSVSPAGGELQLHLTLPAGYTLRGLDAPRGHVWYAGPNADDHRELHFCNLDGSGDVVAHVMDGSPSADASIACLQRGERVYAYLECASTPSSQLYSYALDGSDERLERDFASQCFAAGSDGATLYLVDRASFSLVSASLDDPQALASVAQIPQLTTQTKVSFVECAGGAVWVTTYTADADDATALLTYRVDVATGEVTVIS